MLMTTMLAAWLCTAPAQAAFTTEEMSWRNGEVTLAGTLYLPAVAGRRPAAIFIHGSGNMGRGSERGNDVLRAHAEHLAANGTAVLLYDKRGVGASSGSWRLASFETLAADAALGIERLRTHARIDPARVGIIGLSQGSWLSLMTHLRTPVSFIVWVTGAAVTPGKQEEHVVASRLRAAGMHADVPAALALLRRVQEVFRTDTGWDDLKAQAAAAEAQPWFKTAQIGIAARADAWWRWYAGFMDHDPRPALAALKIPLFAAFAADDQLVDSEESRRVLDGLSSAAITTRTSPSIGHGFRGPDRSLRIPDEYWKDLAAFLDTASGTR